MMNDKKARDEYYRIIKEMWGRVDKNDREAIRQYNEFARQLRHEMLDNS